MSLVWYCDNPAAGCCIVCVDRPAADMIDFPTQPPLMTFKQFLASQDDNISDEDAIRKFNEYKVDFRRQQISDFFMLHKEEEW